MKKQTSNMVAAKAGVLYYTPETKHLFSKEDQHFFEILSKQAPTQPKYYRAQREMVIQDVKKLFRENPSLTAKEVVLKIISILPDFLPAKNIHDVVGYILETWEQCQQERTKKSEKQELATV